MPIRRAQPDLGDAGRPRQAQRPADRRDGGAVGPLSRTRHAASASPIINQKFDLELWSYASLEAQVAAIADDIAYDAHDIDDGLRAGLFDVDELEAMPLAAAIIARDRRGAIPRSTTPGAARNWCAS